MSLPLVCPNLTDPVHCFDDKTRKPCIGQCGHTICLHCITFDKLRRCPVCHLEGAFNKVSVNYTSIALIEACRNRFQEKLKGWADTKTPNAGFCSKLFEETQLHCSICVAQVKIPRICLTCDNETLFKENWWEWRQKNANILKILQRVMCSDCAIENHGEHRIVNHNMNKKSKKSITMALAQNVLNMFRDTIENKKSVIDCFLRRFKIEIIGQNLLKLFGKLEYIEEWECGYLGELIKKELIKKYMENVDEKMLDLFSIQGYSVCDCSRFPENLSTILRESVDVEKHRLYGIKPQVFESGCPLYSWKYMADVRREYSIPEKEFCGVAAKIPPNDLNCPLCLYNGYSQHQKKDFLLENGVSIIGEFCKTETIPLDKCCLNCLDRLNDCQFLLSCEHRKKKPRVFIYTKDYEKKKTCYQNCFMKNSTLWNFVIINHMMADKNLYEVIMYEIEVTVGFADCQLRKIRLKETVNELYKGLNIVRLWKYFDHLSTPIEIAALFESFKQQWNSFRFGNREQEAASPCKCTVIWNKILENKLEREKYEDLETKMIEMARYSMTEEIHGCPMDYSHGIELNKNVIDELENTVGFESTGQEPELTLVENEHVNCLTEKITSNIFPFAHLHCQNEEEQLFDKKTHKPYTGSCGHTICSVCIEEILSGECPVCLKKRSFEGSQLNEDLLREVETIKRNAWETFKELWSNEAADLATCSKCKTYSSDLYICEIANLIRYSESGIETMADVLKISRHILCQRCASVQAEKVYPILFWKNYLKKTNGIFLLKLLDITDSINGIRKRRGDNLEFRRVEVLIKLLKELNYKYKDSCGYDRELIKLKLIDKLVQSNDQTIKQLFMPEGNPHEPIKGCPLCVMVDFRNCAENIEHDCNNWMNVFEHLWSIQSAKFDQCCIGCLLYLNDRYSGSYQTKTEKENKERMENAISEGIEESELKKFKQVLAIAQCNDLNYFMSDKQIWEKLITIEYFFCLLQTMTEGLSKKSFACHLRKIRFDNFLSEVYDVWHMINSGWIVGWKFIKTSNMVKKLNHQFKILKEEMDKEDILIKCECTEIWERNQKIMEKFGHEDCEEKSKLQYLEDSMEEIARFSLEEDLERCPMQYDHGIELDEELVRKLKEATDLGAETNKNKCLCDVIDSFAPISKISDANVNHIVSFFINWWKYEATYPHSICHVCVDRLKLVQNKLSTRSGFYECVLRKMRMLETFNKLIDFIGDFRVSKGRVFKSDIDNMTKLFDNFISQWNLFQFGSEYDQRTWTAGAVCHCTKTLDTSRSLLNANDCWEEEREYNRLMEASKKLAEFDLSENIAGCPLEFDHDIDDACFDPEGISSGTYRCFKLMFCDST